MELVFAIIHWISEFAGSVIQADCTINEFLTPATIYKLFRYLFNDIDFNIHLEINLDEIFQFQSCTLPYLFTNHASIGSHNIIGQIHILELILSTHFKNSNMELPQINLYKLILFHDSEEIKRYCEMLVIIGTYTSKLSTMGLTTVGFLTDEDKIMLEDKMYNQRQKLQMKSPVLNSGNSNLEDYEVISRQNTNSTNISTYIDSDELRLLRWENKLFQSVVFQLGMERSSKEK